MDVIQLRLLGGVELTARDSGRERRLVLAPKPLALLVDLAIAKAGEAGAARGHNPISRRATGVDCGRSVC